MTQDAAAPRGWRGRIPEWAVVTAVYVLAHGAQLLDRGVFWDDWAYFRQPPAELADMARQLGSFWPAWTFEVQWGGEWAVWGTRVCMFAAFLAVALASLRLMRRVRTFDRGERIALASLVAVFPVMGARDAVATSAYPFSLALFMGAWVLLDSRAGRRAPLARVVAFALLVLSTRTASLAIFSVVPLAWLMWRDGAFAEGVSGATRGLLRRAEVLAVPVAYALIRAFVARPSGLYEGYNEITPMGLLTGAVRIPAAFYHSLVAPLVRAPAHAVWPIALAAGAIALAALWARGERDGEARAWLGVAAAGVVVFALGVYPYLAVGKMPSLVDFESRHQLLVPFGAALVLVGAVRACTGAAGLPRAASAALLAAAIGLGAGASAAGHLDYLREWYKERGEIAALRSSPEARSGRTFLFEERAPWLNAAGRTYLREYEYSGLLAEAFGDHVRFGADAAEYRANGPAFYRARLTANYKLDGYREAAPDFLVTVGAGPDDSRDPGVLARLVVDEWSGSPSLPGDAARTVSLSFAPLR